MGVKLTKWAGRVCGNWKLSPLAQAVLLRMANVAIDPDAKGESVEHTPPEIYFMSREELARQIYGDASKARYLDRSIKELKACGLIEPVGLSARKGHTQEYRLCIYEAVAAQYFELSEVYRGKHDTQELGRAFRKYSGKQ